MLMIVEVLVEVVMDEKGEDMEVMIEVAMEVVLGSEMEGRREGG